MIHQDPQELFKELLKELAREKEHVFYVENPQAALYFELERQGKIHIAQEYSKRGMCYVAKIRYDQSEQNSINS